MRMRQAKDRSRAQQRGARGRGDIVPRAAYFRAMNQSPSGATLPDPAQPADHVNPLLHELAWRGLLYQHTDELAGRLGRGTVTAYCGFDPTAPSLHVGNLVPVMGLVHLQRHGHRPIALVGGGTGLIGDPSGKSTERSLSSAEIVAENAAGVRRQLERFIDFEGTTRRPPPRQRRVAVPARRHRLHARRRQALHRQLHARQGVGEVAHRGRYLLHRVLLHVAPGVRLPGALPAPRRHAPGRRQRSVGEHDGGHGADPAVRRRRRRRAHLPAHHQGRRHQVRQDGVGHDLARSGAHVALPVLPVLAQRRRPRRGRASCASSRCSRATRSRRWTARRPSSRSVAPRSRRWPAT